MSNLGEFLTRTHPNDPNSVFRVVATDAPGNQVLFQFTAQADLDYSVQSLDALAATGWQFWMDVDAAPSNRTIIITNTQPLPTQRFFRVVTPQVP
jgi:hypothetical protein